MLSYSIICFCCSKYTNGSVLRMHVDTVNTHVVSAIINVDQVISDEYQHSNVILVLLVFILCALS